MEENWIQEIMNSITEAWFEGLTEEQVMEALNENNDNVFVTLSFVQYAFAMVEYEYGNPTIH
jgi:hypothetical protein